MSPSDDAVSHPRDRGITVAILLIALAARLVLAIHKGSGYHFADTGEYDAVARAFLHGQSPPAGVPRAPLYPLFMAAVYTVAGVGNFAAVRFAQLALGVGAVAVTIQLARRIAGTRAAWLAGVVAALAPTLVYTSTMLYPAALYTLCMLLATLAAFALGRGGGAGSAATLGVALTAAWFTDQVAIVPIAAMLVWVALFARPRGGRLRSLAVTVAAMLVIVAPWLIARSRTQAGSPLFLAKAQYVLQVARHDDAIIGGHWIRDTTAWERFKPLPMKALAVREWHLLRTQPADYLHDYAFEFVHFFHPMPDRIQTSNVYTSQSARLAVALYFAPVLLFALLGVARGRQRGRESVLLLVPPLATACLYAFFFSQMRYRVPVEPQLIVLAACGVLSFMRPQAAEPARSVR